MCLFVCAFVLFVPVLFGLYGLFVGLSPETSRRIFAWDADRRRRKIFELSQVSQ